MAVVPNESCFSCGRRHESVLCSHAEALDEIDRFKVVSHMQTGSRIFEVGESPLGLHTLQSGLVKLETVSENGSLHTLRLIQPGGVLGYRSLFAFEPYNASAICLQDSEVCFIPRDSILRLLKSFPEIALKLLTYLSKDLKQAESKWLDQMDKGAVSRVAEAVLFFNDHFSRQQWTRKEIAQWAGTTTETVIRTLSQFERDNWIDQSQRAIKILNREMLLEAASK